MSFIVPMEKPKRCGLCPCFHAEHPMHCRAVKAHKDKRIIAPYGAPIPDWCPLIELPPHGRLIDVDDFMRHLIINTADLRTLSTGTVGKALHDTPTVIEAEGRDRWKVSTHSE